MRLLFFVISLLVFTRCTPKLNYLSPTAKERIVLLAESIKFDRDGKYFIVKPEKFSHISDKEFLLLLEECMDCTVTQEQKAQDNLKVRDLERMFGIKLNSSTQFCYFRHSGKGVMRYTQKEVEEYRLRNLNPDIFFMFTKDGKYVQLLAFSCDLHG
jgi:hypothetical protein